MISIKKKSLALLLCMFVFRTSLLFAQQEPTPILVVYNAAQFYATEGSIAVNGFTRIVTESKQTDVLTGFETTNVESETTIIKTERFTSVHLKNTHLEKQNKPRTKQTSKNTEVEKPVVQKTTIACPFGNYPTGNHNFYALHNGVATAPTPVKSSPLIPLQRKGEPTLCVEFYFLEIKKSICFYINTQILQSKYIGQITTRPPPILMVNC